MVKRWLVAAGVVAALGACDRMRDRGQGDIVDAPGEAGEERLPRQAENGDLRAPLGPTAEDLARQDGTAQRGNGDQAGDGQDVADKTLEATGKISEIKGDEIVIHRDMNKPLRVRLGPQTTVTVNGEVQPGANLRAGSDVKITYRVDGNSFVAMRVETVAPKNQKRPGGRS